ncbi:S-adenosyl-L-methionine-dependent methyltransferase, partial [Cunninghamella echinulata]
SNFQSPLDTPLKEGIRVLDSGCGPATWLLEMCESYPQSDFYGIDISPMFPENIKPHNVTFDIANVAEGLPFPDNHFDFVFQRLLVFALTADQWEKAFRELIRVLKPGGWIEFVEVDVNAKRSGPLFSVITASMRHMLLSRDMVPNIGNKLEDYVILHHLDNMKVTTKDFPLKHGGKLGDLFWDDFSQVSYAVRPIVAASHPEWGSEENFSEFMYNCGEECALNQTSLTAIIVCAQKPLN